ncbi:SMC5-SMC6 complex localization factor protein 2 [Gracilinanus agilis]|uniref:SMC5-SMC6 complex localization factor protein 2 n=1 Tax=Gracilinanus agilis TaxID=191870 RepID=UPI001CFC9293|nr:SMC5-SMC6 complex localization factor protein 2 [Gracilinanus agilis]
MKLSGVPAKRCPDSPPFLLSCCPPTPDAASPVSRRLEESRRDRNQSITDFFKPIPKQDRLVLNSPQRTNLKYRRDILLDTGIGQFERKTSSPKNMCKKMPATPRNKSPITKTLMGEFKEEESQRDTHERNQPPVTVKSFMSTSHHCLSRNEMKDSRKQEKSPIKMSSHNHENIKEKAKLTDKRKKTADAKILVSSPKPEILKNSSSKIDSENDVSRCHCVKMQKDPENGLCSRKRFHSDSLEAASGAGSSGVSNAKTSIISSSTRKREVTLPKAPSECSLVSTRIKKQKKKNFKDVANTSSVKTSKKSLPFQNSITKASPAVLGDVDLSSPSVSRLSRKKLGNSSSTSGISRKKPKVFFDSDEENLDCNLESDEEEVALKPLQEIMSLNSSQPATPEKPFVLSGKPRALSSNISISLRYQLYENSLERLAKENEDHSRSDEWEKELKEDLVKGQGIKSLIESEEADDSGELQEEHKELLRKFFIALDAIPDCHPGEEIFHFFNYGKIFNQYTLDLRDCNFVPKNAIEDLILKSGRTQQIFLTTQGYLSTAYHYIQCPIPVLKWLFQMMSVHTDYIVSLQLLNTLIDITIRNDATSGPSVCPWIPSLSDIASVFVNMGVSFKCLFPVQNLQPDFNEDVFNSEVQSLSEERASEDSIEDALVLCLPETNILNVVKFMGLCTAVYPEGYTDQEIILLLLMFLKMSLEKHLKQIALVDFQSLLINLLKNIRDWDTKMPELCMAISELSTHHHNLLWLVQFVPNWTSRGRQVRQHLSLLIIAKFLDKKPEDIPSASDMQMSLLCQYLVQMKPSDLLRKMKAKKAGEQQDNPTKDSSSLDLEQQVYYLTYVLLHLVSEVSSYSFPFQRRKYLLQLCRYLEKHIRCCIREDARFFHRTKVIDLVAIIHGKWQEMIQNSLPTQGKLHDFWVPDS